MLEKVRFWCSKSTATSWSQKLKNFPGETKRQSLISWPRSELIRIIAAEKCKLSFPPKGQKVKRTTLKVEYIGPKSVEIKDDSNNWYINAYRDTNENKDENENERTWSKFPLLLWSPRNFYLLPKTRNISYINSPGDSFCLDFN